MKASFIGTAIVLGGSLVAGTAAAEDPVDLLGEYGASITAGGGVGGFTQEEMRDTTSVGGNWGVRAAIGTKFPVGFEAGYLGSAQNIEAIGLDTDAILLGTAVEGLARVNFFGDARIAPYAFFGAAWRRYDLTNVDTNTSDVTETDNLLEIPMGIGVGYRVDHFIADFRGEFRAATYENLIPSTSTDDEGLSMHTWGASVKLGYEF